MRPVRRHAHAPTTDSGRLRASTRAAAIAADRARSRAGPASSLWYGLGVPAAARRSAQAYLPALQPGETIPYSEFKTLRRERQGRRGHRRRQIDPRHAEGRRDAKQAQAVHDDPRRRSEADRGARSARRQVHRRGRQPLAARAARLDHSAALPRRHLGLLLPPHGRRRRRRDVVRAQQARRSTPTTT